MTTRAPSRSTGIAGVGFVVFFLGGFYLAVSAPTAEATPAEWAAFNTGDATAVGVFVGMCSMIVGALSFLWFATTLSDRVHDITDTRTWITRGSAIVYTGVLVATAALLGAVAVNVVFGGNDPELGVDIAHTLYLLGLLLLFTGGGAAVALFIAAVSRAARRTDTLPRWLVATGYAAVLPVALSFLYVTAIVLFIWVLAVSGYLLIHRQPARA